MFIGKLRPQIIVISRLVLLMVVLAWLGFWLVSPAVAATRPDAFQSCFDNPSFRFVPISDIYRSQTDNCSLLALMPPAEMPKGLLPDLRTLPPSDLEIVTLPDSTHELRLSNTIWNSGPGPLELKGTHDPATQKTRVAPYNYTGSDLQYNHMVGEFVWHIQHDHWHFMEFTIYELWTLSPTGELDRVVSTSGKLSYCVVDTDMINREIEDFSPYKRYVECGATLQGLSIGWGDTYKSYLDGQSIPLAGVADGIYALKSVVNPDALLLESDYLNNTALIYLLIRGEKIALIDLNEYIDRYCPDISWWTMPRLICEY